MLEMPECYTVAKQLRETVDSKTILNVYANSSPHGFAFFYGDPALYHSYLTGKTCGAAKAIGGMIEWAAEDYMILFGDGINVRYYAPGAELPPKHQLHIEFDDFSSVVCTVQMYGGMSVFKHGENDNPYYLVAKEKPSPLSVEFDERYFDEMMKASKPTLSLKAFLATEQRIPGLGNGVLQDILFHSRLHPKSKLNSLSDEQTGNLFKIVKQTLFNMAAKGGRDTEKDLFGAKGGYETILSSKTLKDPCPVCGDTIIRQAYLGGNIYFCPTCQPIK